MGLVDSPECTSLAGFGLKVSAVFHAQGPDNVHPMALPQPGGVGAAAFLPVNFPATKGQFASLTTPAVTSLLQGYGLHTNGTKHQRINRIAQHVGLRNPFA